jgi:hypothetical protein
MVTSYKIVNISRSLSPSENSNVFNYNSWLSIKYVNISCNLSPSENFIVFTYNSWLSIKYVNISCSLSPSENFNVFGILVQAIQSSCKQIFVYIRKTLKLSDGDKLQDILTYLIDSQEL